MNWASTTMFLGESLLTWAALIGTLVAVATAAAGVWVYSTRSREPKAIPISIHDNGSTDSGVTNRMGEAIMYAPAVYVAVETAAAILKEKLREHSLDAIAQAAPAVLDPVTGTILADALLSASDGIDGISLGDIASQLLG